MAMLIPEAWDADTTMRPDKKAFYEYHASLMEPWDGPAAIAFTDGRVIGATLDRNGLRPARYLVTHDDLLIMASETGVLPVKPEDVKFKGRLQPGKHAAGGYRAKAASFPTRRSRNGCASRQPYGEWLKENQITLDSLPEPPRVYGSDLDTIVHAAARLRLHRRRHPRADAADGGQRAKSRSARWAPTRRWRASPTSRSRCSTTSSSCSRR